MTTSIYKSGIYQILNLVNGKSYIGYSIHIKQRWSSHIHELKNNKHKNIYLQRSWDKYGIKNFKFICIEEVLDYNILLEKEGWWIDKLQTCNGKFGYNLTRYDPNTKRQVFSEERKRNIGNKTKGRKHTTKLKDRWKVERRGSGNTNAKTFIVYFVDGTTRILHGEQKKFCEEYNMTKDTFVNILHNRKKRRYKFFDIIKIEEV